MAWLVAGPTFGKMLVAELWLSFLYASYNGAMVVALTEVMPVDVRTVGFSLAYSLATAIFGGFTPVVSTFLIQVTGNKGAPGLWMSFAAVCGLIGTLGAISAQRGRKAGGVVIARVKEGIMGESAVCVDAFFEAPTRECLLPRPSDLSQAFTHRGTRRERYPAAP